MKDNTSHPQIFTLSQNAPQQIIQKAHKLISSQQQFIFQGYKRSLLSQSSHIHQSYYLLIKIIPHIIEWRIQSLSTRLLNPQKTLLMKICHITFGQLKIIDLSNNNIDNIQALAYIDCCKLAFLSLSQNSITSLKPFAKCIFTNLRNLNVGLNLINHNNLQYLTRHFASASMSELKLSIESYHSEFSKKSVEYSCVNQVFKWKTNDISMLTVQSTFLVLNQALYDKLHSQKLNPRNYLTVFRVKSS